MVERDGGEMEGAGAGEVTVVLGGGSPRGFVRKRKGGGQAGGEMVLVRVREAQDIR